MSPRPHLTHIAIHARDVDASIDFYRRFVGLYVVHERCDNGTRVVWLSEEPGEPSFVIVLIGVRDGPKPLPALTEHLGYDLPSRAAVDEIAERAREAGVLAHGPVDLGPIVGYLCMLRDPDGNVIEFSNGQPITPRQLRARP